MMRSGRSDPRLMVREVEEDDNQEDNEDQETFVLHGADPDSNISLEKRSGLGQNLEFIKSIFINLISRKIKRME